MATFMDHRLSLCLITALMFHSSVTHNVQTNVFSNITRLRLFNYLMANYSKSVRLQTTPTVVTMDPALYSIIDVDEARESITVAQWLDVVWTDYMLSWDPKEFDGITKMRIQQDHVWIPDITIYQLLETTRQGRPEESFLTINHDGQVLLSRTEQVTIHCLFDVGHFPFDRQNCSLTYVTWAYPDTEIILKPKRTPEAQTAYYKSSTVSEWLLINFTCYRFLVNYGQQAGFWYEVSYHLHIERKPFYYLVTLAIPSFFITNLALIGVFSPSQADQDRSEKVSIGLTALLTMAVILMMVSELMPKNAKSFPKLGSFILWEMCIMVCSTVVAVAIMYLHSRAHFGKAVPNRLKRMLIGKRYLFANFDFDEENDSNNNPNMNIGDSAVVENRFGVGNFQNLTSVNTSYFKIQCKIYLSIRELLHCVRQVHEHLNDVQAEAIRKRMAQNDWTVLCHKLDLCCLILSLVINAVVTYLFANYDLW